MCQLILLNLGDPTLHKVFLPTFLQIASIGNEDGTGFLAVDKKSWNLYKNVLSASNIEELGMDIRDHITSKYPVMGHVRYASKGIAVTEENTHPFAGARFILSHNGRLYGKNEKVVYNANDTSNLASDSLVFLNRLEEVAKDAPKKTFLELINKAMDDFKGKFAFLIYDSLTDIHYIARGDTADLHIASVGEIPIDGGEIKPIGFSIVTKKTTMQDALSISSQIAQAVTGRRIVYGKTEEIKKNTLFRVDGVNLVEVGELKEKPSYTYQKDEHQFGNSMAGRNETNTGIPIWKWAERIQEFMEAHFLDVHDIDAIMGIFLGIGMADAQIVDIERFVSEVIPKISASRKIREKITKLLGIKGCIYPILYDKVPGLQYPWMQNEKPLIDKLIKYLDDTKKEK